ncbi:MAG TPA: polysaccharide biosynthesis/export family protein [Terriglobales bacterium]|nr:polysaccharide biosynthesis/export family protein [Terriglobales bacterium]
MRTFVQSVAFVAGGLLNCQLFLVASAPIARSQDHAPQPTASASDRLDAPGTAEGSGQTVARISAKGEASNSGPADGKGDPALGGERHPPYRLTKSDVLDINFTFSPDFNQAVTIQPDGFVALRGAGQLLAEGSTVANLQQAIAKAYSGFLHDPEVTVTLKDFEKPYFLASGEVSRPGKYELRGDLTVNEAVAIAGGFTQQARHSQVVLFRRVSLDVAEAHLIDVKKMLNSRNLREDWHLQPGDFIFVPQSRISKIRKFVPTNSMNWYLNPLQF